MNHRDLFQDVVPLLRPEGGVAVVTNETPLWLQETDWSRVLRDFLQHWLGTTLTHACGTAEQSQRRYRGRSSCGRVRLPACDLSSRAAGLAALRSGSVASQLVPVPGIKSAALD